MEAADGNPQQTRRPDQQHHHRHRDLGVLGQRHRSRHSNRADHGDNRVFSSLYRVVHVFPRTNDEPAHYPWNSLHTSLSLVCRVCVGSLRQAIAAHAIRPPASF